MLHKFIVTVTALFIACSAVAELLIPSEMLRFVGITSNQQTDFLLRTTAVALIALVPGILSARTEAHSSASRSALLGVATYMLLSSAVDYQAFTQGVVNIISVPSVVLRVLWGMAILGWIVRGASK
jgi:hypothetical protein